MTAEEWEAGRNPQAMLEVVRGRISTRQLQLLGVACCRRVWPWMTEQASRAAVETTEIGADCPVAQSSRIAISEAAYRTVKEKEREADHPQGGRTRFSDYRAEAVCHAAFAAFYTSLIGQQSNGRKHPAETALVAAANTIRYACGAVAQELGTTALDPNGGVMKAAFNGEVEEQTLLLRCVFRNPFRLSFTVSPAVLAFNDGAAVKLATVICEERDPSTGLLDSTRLAILADALEEAGVDDRAALNHLRGPGPHCRGCHVVDAVLGRS